jgi:outer membrane biosynthesis protein TonB
MFMWMFSIIRELFNDWTSPMLIPLWIVRLVVEVKSLTRLESWLRQAEKRMS